jgi:hypothetical protein
MRTTHADHHFSITVRSDDLAVVGCLRAVAQHCQQTGNARIAWGHTKEPDWRRAGKRVTFHFSEPNYREEFKLVASRVIQTGLFAVESERDDDPATPADE